MKQRSAETDRSNLIRRIANLPPAKRALLEQKLKVQGFDSFVKQIISRRATWESSPLSFAQRRLWFLDQYEPNSSVYNVPSAQRLKGPLDIGALERSLNELVRRHEALRTTFTAVEGQPVQIISPPLSLSLAVVDLTEHPESDRESEAQRLAAEEGRKPFDLGQGPLFRTTLIKVGEDDHVLLLTMHHIVSDGWSMGVLQHELSVLYRAFIHGQPSPLADLPIQYADYAVWQREWLQGEILESQLSYWKKQLEGAPAILNLPTDRSRPAVQSFRGARQSIELSTDLTQRLKALSRKEGVTLFMTLLAAFQTLLYRYTAQDDIVVGSPIANRNQTEIEGLIGFFVNTLVLRTDFSANPTFRELLHRVQEMALGAYAHQDLPFEKLVEELRPDRDLSRSPLFQVMFVLQNAPSTELRLENLRVSPVRVGGETAKFDLMLSVHEAAEGLRASLQYSTDLFNEETITRMLGHLEVLLESIVGNPDQRIAALSILTEAERYQLLVEWNDTRADYPRDKCIHELFEEQVERTPEAVAVVFEDQQLTYRELNNRANQLAHYLQKLGVRSEVLVGICVERSVEMVVGLLGILKAGGAYLPIDPDFPRGRIEFMLHDSQAPFLLTQARLEELIPSFAGARISLDRDWCEIARESAINVGQQQNSDNLAYVIYTSGSTGKPKGVMIQHSSVVNFLASLAREPGLTETDILLAVTTLSFDIAGLEIYLPLTLGARVVLARREVAVDGVRLAKQLSDCGATLMQATPATWHMLLASGWQGSRELKILCGGEALSDDLAKQLVDRCASLWNVYGPTETTIWSSVQRVPANVGRVALGGPIANTQLYILDQNLNPVPIGVAGELYVGGLGLARGYLNRPELTAEKFIPNRFSAEPGARLYKTGDRARYLADGNIEFLGRIDNQIKLRGYRIEPGEIEAVLKQHPGVRESVVLGWEDAPGDPSTPLETGKQLVAYVVPNQEPAPAIHELRSFLKEKLPEYMVPSAYVFLDSLPLTANGKVDRRALPAPAPSRPELDETFSDPRTPTEEVLASIWAEVLKLEKVGIYDNFFELGGHSLLATQVISRLTKAIQIELPLRSLFESPTVAGLAERIEQIRRGEMGSPALPILPMPRDGDFPLSFAQQRLWFLDQLEPNSSVYNIPSGLRLKGPLDIGALEQSLNEIVRRHETLRTTFAVVEGQPVQSISPSLSLPLSLIDLSHWPESEREDEARRLANEEAQRPFDLAHGPLMRSVLLHLSSEDHVLLLTVHHIASDGWSMSILYRELSALYEAFSNGKPSPLEELPVQYADFAQWQRNWLQGEVLETQLGYWKKQLENVQTLQLSTDRPRPAVRSYRGARQSIVLSRELTEALKTLGRKHDVTLYMTLLAAFQTLLHRYTGQDDIVVGSPIAGRNHQEIEGLIGFFVNTLILRNDLSENPRFRELLARSRKTALEAFEHQDLPFEKLVEELQPERNLSYSPFCQVMFVLQNAPSTELRLEGLSASPVRVGGETAKFDVTLSVHEAAEGLRASLQYSTDLFNEETITRMLGHFEVLLESIVGNPDQRISALPILTEAERYQLLVEWNDTRTDYSRDKCIHELFEEQVERTPEAVAVVFEGRQLTYRELNQRANQVAHYLIKQGVEPETLAGICMERSVEMVIGLLGVLKAGGAYVPLDPNYPKERLGFMVEDTHAGIVLTEMVSLNSLPLTGRCVICLDRDWEEIAKEPQVNPSSQSTGDSLAYVIYTSGSTGVPKGVEVRHRGVVRLLFGVDYVQLDRAQTFLHLAPISFDAATLEVWGALLHGGKCVLFPGKVPSPRELGEVLKKNRVNTLWLTAALFNTVINEEPKALSEVKQLLIGGEALSVPHVREGLAQLPNTEIINGYGPTESTTFTCCYRIPRQLDNNLSSIPIGKPIGNTQVYILDPHLNPVPIGVAGELHIGGDGLAQGYLNRLELTAEKFIVNPFNKNCAPHLYKTGDRARFLPDGNIEFLGRLDDQVKIRGYRIELGEIEAILARHPAVREAVVLAREESPTDKRLVAYVVPNQEPVPAIHELRSFLKQQLPEYMVPSAYVFLDSLPLTANGKVDRKALPMPDRSRPARDETFSAPRTPVEDLLANIWAEVLKLDHVGIYDNFFEMGGHSLLATQVVSRVRAAFRVELPLRSLFENSTVAGLAENIENARRKEQGGQALPIVAASRDEELSLSFAQQRLWFLDQYEPNSSVYNVPSAQRLKGPLDIRALEQSLNEIVRRHEALRTTFAVVEGRPIQIILPSLSLPLSMIDLSRLPESEREDEARRLINEEAQAPFDLAHGPLMRSVLLHLSSEDHVLLLTVHHIASDGWSMSILHRELSVLYEAFSNGKPSPLKQLPIQYVDFAQWQRNWLQGEVFETQLDYWKKQLDNVQTLQLSTDRPRPAVQRYRGARQSIVLSRELTETLKTLSRQQGVTLFMALLSAFQVLLYRYTGQDDIAVGSVIAGRNRREIEGLIGFFVNTLVLRTDVSGDLTFKELLERVRGVCLSAYSHQDLPFEKLVEELQPQRNLNQNPLFQVMFVLQNAPSTELKFEGLRVSPVRIDAEAAKFDLTLSMHEGTREIRASLQYNVDLFDHATIHRMIGNFQVLLESIVTNPDRKIFELPILTEAEKRKLLVEWNATEREYPKDKCIHQLFEEQVERTPDAVAVAFEGRQLSYRELNERANHLAHYLRKLGVGPEALVALCMERSSEIIVGILGILKSGNAYTPLDPAYPSERLSFMLRDSKASVILTQQRLIDRLPPHNAQMICLGMDWEEIAKSGSTNMDCGANADSLAYVMYTSGSTGTPKGVEVPHRGIARLLFGVDYIQFGATQTFLHLAPISFDASTFELWGALLHGAKCVLYPNDIPGPKELGVLLKKHQISILWLTSSLFNTVIDEAPEALSGIRQLLVGGEALSVPHVRRALKLLPDTQIINGYGPTESTTFTCCYRIPREPDENMKTIPIGRPIGNTEVYIVDRYLNPVPIGVPGELLIGGDGLARGYFNREELTGEKFIRNPFNETLGARLYKTGDRARYLQDGNIEFLGRLDNQAKIRGFRIEPGEVESALAQHPAVEQVVVSVREDRPGDKRLVAYVVCNSISASAASELRDFVKRKLPEYMIPSSIMFLDELPLTLHGKVDYRSLPAPVEIADDRKGRSVAPRDKLELRLVTVWEEILGMRPVGVRENFFELGGHSLLAVRLLARVEKELGRPVPLAALFEGPTIEEMANLLRHGGEAFSWNWLVPLQPVGYKPPLFLLHGSRELAKEIGTEHPVYGIRPHGLDGKRAPLRAEEMAADYVREIRTLQPEGSYLIAGYSLGGLLAFEVAQQLKEQGQEVALLAMLDPTIPRKLRLASHDRANANEVATTPIGEKFFSHFRKIWSSGIREKPVYIQAAVAWRFDSFKRRIKLLACQALLNLGQRVPVDLRRFYFMEAGLEAARNYVPKVYHGDVVLLSRENAVQDHSSVWSGLVTGRLEICEMPSGHLEAIQGPNVKAWAEQLRVCLRRP